MKPMISFPKVLSIILVFLTFMSPVFSLCAEVRDIVTIRRGASLEAFYIDYNAKTLNHANWSPGQAGFSPWKPIRQSKIEMEHGSGYCAKVRIPKAVSRHSGVIEVFWVDTRGNIWFVEWTSALGWREPGIVPGGRAHPDAPFVEVVARNSEQLDLFVVGPDNTIQTSGWNPVRGWDAPFGKWTGFTVHSESQITAVSRSLNLLDIFVVGTDGRVKTAAWAPGVEYWTHFRNIKDLVVNSGAKVSVVSRNTDYIDIFVVGKDLQVYTAAWRPGPDDWRGWWTVPGVQTRGPVEVVTRRQNYMDLFVVDNSFFVQTAAWSPSEGWKGWWNLNEGKSYSSRGISAVSRATDMLDVFGFIYTASSVDIQTAHWQPSNPDWFCGWFPIQTNAGAC